jgi:hypothetical protein
MVPISDWISFLTSSRISAKMDSFISSVVWVVLACVTEELAYTVVFPDDFFLDGGAGKSFGS